VEASENQLAILVPGCYFTKDVTIVEAGTDMVMGARQVRRGETRL